MRFRTCDDLSCKGWEFSNEAVENGQVKIHRGLILSGGMLLDNEATGSELLESSAHFHGAEGGDMEGSALADICRPKHITWILVKGICDFGGLVGHKDKSGQSFAAAAAVSLVHFVLDKEQVVRELKGNLVVSTSSSSVPKNRVS